MSVTASPFSAGPDGVVVRLRVMPKASAARLQGVAATADGTATLKVAVTAAPEDGRANAAVIAVLAKAWRLPKSALTIVAGAKDRQKTLRIAADSAAAAGALAARLDAWLAARLDTGGD